MDLELSGKNAIVTGGAKGIGLAVAEVLTSEGMRVAIVDMDERAGRDAAARLEGAVFVACDLADREAIRRAADTALHELDGLHVLVNNAGVQEYGTVLDTPEEQWDKLLAVNLTSAFLMSKLCTPHILEAGGGAIVNTASVQGLVAQKGVTAYAASKGGMIQLTRAMAVDLAPRIRVNCVCPGSVDTPMLRAAARLFGGEDPDGTIRGWGAMHPMGRAAQPEEVANVVAFLASPRAGFVTGSAYLVDGGLLAVLGGTGD